MASRRLTLPRHTNIAPQGRRISAFLIDLAITLAISLVAFFGAVKWIFQPTLDELNSNYQKEALNSCLFIDEGDGIKNMSADSSFEEFRDVVYYFYSSYLTGENLKEGLQASKNKDQLIENKKRSEYYTVSWFNENVLGLSDEPNVDCLFKFASDGVGGVDKTVLGVMKDNEELTIKMVSSYMQQEVLAAQRIFNNQDYVVDMINHIGFINSLEITICALVGGIVNYIVIPWFMKNGVTLGKKVNKLALANSEGYKLNNRQLFMRLMPYSVVFLSLIIPMWTNLFYVILAFLVIFIVSFALAMASPKKQSLHDYCARTIVIDDASSIIFSSISEEEDYIFKEDGIEEEVKEDE